MGPRIDLTVTPSCCVDVAADENAETISVLPILRIADYKPIRRLVSVAFPEKGHLPYFIGEVQNQQYQTEPALAMQGQSVSGWTPSVSNKTEFTLLAYLFNQASIDSSKLPIQQLIDVR